MQVTVQPAGTAAPALQAAKGPVRQSSFGRVLKNLQKTEEQKQQQEMEAALSGVLNAYLAQPGADRPAAQQTEVPDLSLRNQPAVAKGTVQNVFATGEAKETFWGLDAAAEPVLAAPVPAEGSADAAFTVFGTVAESFTVPNAAGSSEQRMPEHFFVRNPFAFSEKTAVSSGQPPIESPQTAAALPDAEQKDRQMENSLLQAVKNRLEPAEPLETAQATALWQAQGLKVLSVGSSATLQPESSPLEQTAAAAFEALQVQTGEEGKTFQLQLYPKELGQVQIHMTLEEGRVKLLVSCREASTQEALMNGFPKLSTVLSEKMGYQVSAEFSQLPFSAGQQGGFGQPEQQNPQAQQPLQNSSSALKQEESFEDYVNRMIETSYFCV